MVAAPIYRCTDTQGKIFYSDAACEATKPGLKLDRVLEVEVPPSSAATPAKIAPVDLPPAALPKKAAPHQALFRLFYDPKNQPIEHSQPKMEALIKQAGRLWSQGCKVSIEYGGVTDYKGSGSAERVVIRWSPEYFSTSHPAMEGVKVAGSGSVKHGVALLPRLSDEALLSVMVHELGHVLGLGHRHRDYESVMSYLGSRAISQPSPGDYLACNRAMKRQFGIDFQESPGAQPDSAAAMSDREALELRARKMAEPISGSRVHP